MTNFYVTLRWNLPLKHRAAPETCLTIFFSTIMVQKHQNWLIYNDFLGK